MRQLLPTYLDDVDPARCYRDEPRPAPEDRPWVLANMATSIDGATAIDGVSGSLGGPTDRAVFAGLRSLADVVLVAAGTVRAEGYGPVRLEAAHETDRRGRGQAPLPRLAIVTARLDLDLTTALFTESRARPLVLTVEAAPPERRRAAAAVADVVLLGEHAVDLRAALAWLRRDGEAAVVLCEGGPSLIGGLAAADAIDELCVTIAGTLVVGDTSRLARGPELQPATALRLTRVLEADGTLFVRYTR